MTGTKNHPEATQSKTTPSEATQSKTASPEATPSLGQALRQFGRLVRLIRPYWGGLTKGILLALVLGLIGVVSPYFTKLLIDEVYPSGDVSLMHVLVGGLLAFGLARALLGAYSFYFNLYVNAHMGRSTRLRFFNHLQHLEARFFDQHQVGEINSRFQDVGQALAAIGRIFQTVFVQGIYLLLVPPILFLLEWRLALVALATLPLILAVTVLSGRILRRYWKRNSEAQADLNAFQIETLSHIRTFKTLGLEGRVYQRAQDFTDHATEQQIRAGGLSQWVNGATSGLHALNTALLTWFGWTLILSRQMSLGEYMAFVAYMGFLYNPLLQLIQLFSDFQQSAVHLARMFEYLDAPVEQDPELAKAPPAPIRHRLDGAFQLRGVDFAYVEEQPILRAIDLSFTAGSTTAIVGPSGAGKTSLLRLLAHLEKPTAGQIIVDGLPLAELPLSELRQQLSVVWQDVSLLKGTLWENLTLGNSEAPSREDVDRLVELCGLGQLLHDLPQGYDTPVAEWGATLSAGQRQRVALTRALLRSSPILLLDEATANIDVETEMEILRRAFRELSGTTVIYVTHRLASAALADRICVLENGTLRGFGHHRDLLANCPAYQRMHDAATPTDATFPRSTDAPKVASSKVAS